MKSETSRIFMISCIRYESRAYIDTNRTPSVRHGVSVSTYRPQLTVREAPFSRCRQGWHDAISAPDPFRTAARLERLLL